MNKKHRIIPNPNKISEKELDFIQDHSIPQPTETITTVEAKKYKTLMISMPDPFYRSLNHFLELNPTEGNRSSFIVRVVADYIRAKVAE